MLEYFLDMFLSVGPAVASGKKVLYSEPFSDSVYSFRHSFRMNKDICCLASPLDSGSFSAWS